MGRTSELVARMRAESGLSQRALADRVGCSRSTITRIEAGEMDPTVTMLSRIVSAAGRRLLVEAVQPDDDRPRLAEIAQHASDIEDLDWTRLRAIIDWLHLHPDRIEDVIVDAPPRTGDPRADNLLAAVAERLADDAGLDRPGWTRSTPPLTAAWTPPGTPRMQATEAATAPHQFSSRNLLLGEQNLWRVARSHG